MWIFVFFFVFKLNRVLIWLEITYCKITTLKRSLSLTGSASSLTFIPTFVSTSLGTSCWVFNKVWFIIYNLCSESLRLLTSFSLTNTFCYLLEIPKFFFLCLNLLPKVLHRLFLVLISTIALYTLGHNILFNIRATIITILKLLLIIQFKIILHKLIIRLIQHLCCGSHWLINGALTFFVETLLLLCGHWSWA